MSPIPTPAPAPRRGRICCSTGNSGTAILSLHGAASSLTATTFWRRQAPMLHAMSFDQIVANDMVILGGPERVANTILRLANQLDLMGLAMIFKLGAMPYDMVERSMSLFGEEVVPRIRHVLTHAVTVDRMAAEPSNSIQRAASYSSLASRPAVWPPTAST